MHKIIATGLMAYITIVAMITSLQPVHTKGIRSSYVIKRNVM